MDDDRKKRYSSEHHDPVGADLDWFRNHEVALLKIKHKRLREKYGEGEIPCESKTGTGPILLSWDLMAHKGTLSSVH